MKKLTSLSIALSFMVLAVTGISAYWLPYSRINATVHTVFGLAFAIGILFHMRNNFKSILFYIKQRTMLIACLIAAALLTSSYLEKEPFRSMMDFAAKSKATEISTSEELDYEILEVNTSKDLKLNIDLLRGEHYWHPQMAIWTEDSAGNYLETLFVTQATANGLFFGGRSKSNYKAFDSRKNATGAYRRVDALPVWSHKRGIQYPDGMFVPTREDPLPDGMSGATLSNNFLMTTSTGYSGNFKLKIEINVAFDDNEYYSEYDFPNDETFHSGTGQLGQPSIVFETAIDMHDQKNYYLMELIGHGHHSAQSGTVYKDLSTLTTALEIVERIVVGVE